MLRALLVLRRVLPDFATRKLLQSYWSFFWRREEKSEELALERQSSSPVHGSERAVLIETIAACYPFTSLLEVGCGYGQNFHVLAKLFPRARFVGVDIDANRVSSGQALLESRGCSNARLVEGCAWELTEFPDNSSDVVISCALLLFIDSSTLDQTLREMLRIARRKVILLEQHTPDLAEQQVARDTGLADYWLRDYRAALARCVAAEAISVVEVPNPRWEVEQWKDYAAVISVTLS